MTIDQYVEMIKYGIWPVALVLARYMLMIERNRKDIDVMFYKYRQTHGVPGGMRCRSIKGSLKRATHKLKRGP